MKIITEKGTITKTAVEWNQEKKQLVLIDQRLLPQELGYLHFQTMDGVPQAIKSMVVRGAPAIGLTGVFGLLLQLKEILEKEKRTIEKTLDEAFKQLLESRPTAVDLELMMEKWLIAVKNNNYNWKFAEKKAIDMFKQSKEECYQIGVHGATLISDGMHILTHCNAGALATSDYGTALAPMRVANEQGIEFHVWVDETRPRLQGARLTGWELQNEGINHDIIVDSAAAYFMSENKVDLIIVGTDRVTGDGWFANKIGTHSLALAARHYEIPFYVAMPWSTFHYKSKKEEATIEERDSEEVLHCPQGHLLANEKSTARNPSFDWTKVDLISGFITPKGIFTYDELKKQL
jgi:translation initiation factor eIF-2B subunit alpha/methylthioribose-1-phosphate isomerase